MLERAPVYVARATRQDLVGMLAPGAYSPGEGLPGGKRCVSVAPPYLAKARPFFRWAGVGGVGFQGVADASEAVGQGARPCAAELVLPEVQLLQAWTSTRWTEGQGQGRREKR